MDSEDTDISYSSSFETSHNETNTEESINILNIDANSNKHNVSETASYQNSLLLDSFNDVSNIVSDSKNGSKESTPSKKSNKDPNDKRDNVLGAQSLSLDTSDDVNDETNYDASFNDSSIIHGPRKTNKIHGFSSEEEKDTAANTVSLSNTVDAKATTNNTTTDTKYTAARPKKIINSSSSESEDNAENDIIDVSDEEEVSMFSPKKQLTLPQMFIKKNNSVSSQREKFSDNKLIENAPPKSVDGQDSIRVSQVEYDNQMTTVKGLQEDFRKIEGLMHTINLSALPDQGQLLRTRHESLKNAVKVAETKLQRMIVDKDLTSANEQLKPAAWEDLKFMSENVQPKTFGERAIATLNAQKTLTMERLQQLHTSLTTCPGEETYAEDPKGLRIELMPHQKRALAWLLWREGQKPSGGILADDMGLGKTLTMIALMLKSREIKQSLDDDDSDEENRTQRNYKHQGKTLVVCPASLLKQWEGEVNKHCKKYLLSILLYHGPKRETRAKILANNDMVITTYAICMNENAKKSPLYQVQWRRIILDEAHQIRNHKSQTSVAVCALSAYSRWALTGTPVHNKEEDMYSLLKFLRCSPFDDLAVWKRWVANKNAGGQDRINTVLSSIMLRRTKSLLQEKNGLLCLPDRTSETICLKLEAEEQAVYQKILIFSRTLFAQYLHQHTEKQSDYMRLGEYSKLSSNPQNIYYQMHKKMVTMNRVKEVKSHEILVLLLRLRQMCCHPSLIVKMLHSDQLVSEDVEGYEEFNLLEEMRKMNLDDNSDNVTNSNQQEDNEGFDRPLKELLNPENPLFSEDRKSTKMEAVLKLLREKILPTNEKAIVVSQWTSLLRLLAIYLKEEKIPFEQLDGSVPVIKRMPIVDNFNNPSGPAKVLLLSLTAGGVGLNLVGGNHMLLLDLHWNPQLEAQAQDRIYRVGQLKKVHVYKFMALNTIEERIKGLQELKLNIANSMLTGSKMQHMKLSLQDLRMLFNM